MRIRKDTLVRIRQKAHLKSSRLNVMYSITDCKVVFNFIDQMSFLIVGVGDDSNSKICPI